MRLFILDERTRELIGTRRALSALYTAQKFDDLVDIASYGEPRNALRIAAAAVYELNRSKLVIIDFEHDLARARAVRGIFFHYVTPLFY